VCDHLIILSSSSVCISGATAELLAEHAVLVGPSGEPSPSGVEIISTRKAERQLTLLVQGTPTDLGPSWQVLRPDLDEIVLAYLEREPDAAEVGRPARPSGDEGGSGS
jgi:ABC-2 type transport system ATP-binding protein